MKDIFANRHIGIDSDAQQHMLKTLGYSSVAALMNAALPENICSTEKLASLPKAASEAETLAELREIASQNRISHPMIGQGYYGTITPAVIARNVLENPSWYTAYTPYQPEISQGRLEALLNFQTMVSDLTGLAIANASMLDEATAVVEGMLLARRASKSSSDIFLVDSDIFLRTRTLLVHRADALGITLLDTDFSGELPESFGAVVQYPGASGRLWNPAEVIASLHAKGSFVVLSADLLALALVKSPGELGADIAVGSTQRFGVPLGFGGPHAGYLAVRTGLERQLPGRLVGVSRDADGHPAYRLSLQTREQHIRREKATSNICTAQVLLAVVSAMYAVYHGAAGIKTISHRVNRLANLVADALREGGILPIHEIFFDTIRVQVPARAADIVARAEAEGVLLWQVDEDTVQFSFDETTSETHALIILRAILGESAPNRLGFKPVSRSINPENMRQTTYLTHLVFQENHSETRMMRYLKRLADKDYALDRGMIPLGSCTMKLNAASEMTAITWPEFSGLHPLAPKEHTKGYAALIDQLSGWLAEITGYDSVSLQPNAGSQGELAGLLAIRAYHHSRADKARTVCLIPESAHGTNAASAVLAGMRVVVIACDMEGNVDLADLRAKIALHGSELAALMITYPSTHGVYETAIREICDAVHAVGGQVYIDGANLNALVGYARPGDFGGDVSHLNLHKTFCIPHGGGGPGVGPVAAKAHLAPYLPRGESNPISQARYGSASVLPITWAYLRMMGEPGLVQATGAAVLAANYLAARLGEHYPVLYTGQAGLVAHECILDLRPLTTDTGITVEDVAKRLIDYGFHAPTVSFPVPGTLMVEPTESEDLTEIDRFIDALIRIKKEADSVAKGVWSRKDNPLVNAPHTAGSVITGEWNHPYTREEAVYPVPDNIHGGKYWPPVRRIEQAYGDRNLVCSCV